ncbi:MAG: hypothetical protein Q4D80_07120 [Pseudomonadota bacterium]|nr:hypothetical protein [Pseudomonadota bacterium]
MKKLIAMLGCLAFIISACDSQKAEETPVEESQTDLRQQENVSGSAELWESINGEPSNFEKAFNQFNEVQKYYFCTAFTVGAMSVSKPETASAMVNYLLGLGVVKYNQGIDNTTYPAFDSGKHIFRYELVVNDILDKKICEDIMVEATEYAKNNNYTAETLNDKGKSEVEKIVQDFLKQ